MADSTASIPDYGAAPDLIARHFTPYDLGVVGRRSITAGFKIHGDNRDRDENSQT
jgi:hypothetical protein